MSLRAYCYNMKNLIHLQLYIMIDYALQTILCDTNSIEIGMGNKLKMNVKMKNFNQKATRYYAVVK